MTQSKEYTALNHAVEQFSEILTMAESPTLLEQTKVGMIRQAAHKGLSLIATSLLEDDTPDQTITVLEKLVEMWTEFEGYGDHSKAHVEDVQEMIDVLRGKQGT